MQIEVLDASRFGVPQMRKRLFILADRERLPLRVPRKRGRPLSASRILDPDGFWASSPLWSESRAVPTIERAKRAIAALGTQNPFLIV